MTAVFVILLVAFLILVHEFGHFLAALVAKIPVSRFSLGFGPKIFAFQRKSIEFRVSAVPLGGYVMPDLPDLKAYFRIPLPRRILFSLGGPLFNVLLPVPLFALGNLLTSGFSVTGVFLLPFVQTGELLLQLVLSLPQLLSNPQAVAGPVGVVAAGSRFVAFGPVKAIAFTAFLSLNFAVFNLLPLPVLDGGKILLSVVHRLFPRSERAFVPATVASLLLLFCVLAAATAADIARIVS
jgi:regulator of sigma E protease